MEPYESVYVGNFIFTLGYITKEKGIELNSQGAALMAQNVGDQVVADLISAWGGRNFIIEFKRNEESVKTEFEKVHKKELIRCLNEKTNDNVARKLASRGHFVGYGVFEPNKERADINFSQYHKVQKSNLQTEDRVNLADFIFNLVMNEKWGLSNQELESYIDILASVFASSESSSGGGRIAGQKLKKVKEMSSLIINYNEHKAEINFVVCNLSKAKELTLKPEIEHRKTMSRGYSGPSMSMGR